MAIGPQLTSGVVTIGIILIVMAAVALLEAAIPLHARTRWNTDHLAPNLALTFITFATNIVFNVALVLVLVGLERHGVGLLRLVPLPSLPAAVLTVLVLDFSFYVAHRAMHRVGTLWRFHRVHHSDPAVDVTTTIRQHPGESVIRYAFMAAFACGIGASPGAFAVYRAWSALNGLLEHANIRMPRRFDAALSLVVVTPNVHKVHHSRLVAQTDTNYGNIVTLFDRLFGTFTPSVHGVDIPYGLAGHDEPALQTMRGLLASPFRPASIDDREAVAIAARAQASAS